MKKEFPGYYRPTEDEFNSIWESCDFLFDTNILLNLYRYSEDTKNQMIGIFKDIKGRIWIPHQVGKEYHIRRVTVVKELADAYEKVESTLSKYRKKITDELTKIYENSRHPLINCDAFIDEMSELIESSLDKLHEKKQEHPDYMVNDPIKDKLSELFEDKVCDHLDSDDMDRLVKEGEDRYKEEIPPGYKDIDKPIPERYGDLIIWFEIIKHAKKRNKPIIFVTDDGKEDWWYRPFGKTLGPRPELVSEILQKAEVKFYMYSADQFMRFAEEYLDSDVEDEAIDEAKEIRLQNERTQAIIDGQKALGNIYKSMQNTVKFPNYSTAFNATQEAMKNIYTSPALAAMQREMENVSTSPAFAAMKEAMESVNNSPAFAAMKEAMESVNNSPAFAAMEETAKIARNSLISAALHDYDARVKDALSLTSTGTFAESINELAEIDSTDQKEINNLQDEEKSTPE